MARINNNAIDKKLNKGGFDREEFNKHLIQDDDIKITSCCKRTWYKTKKNYKCPGCKENVTKDIIARGLMQGIDKMMKAKEKEKNEETKNISSSET